MKSRNLFLSSSTLSWYRFIYVFVTICNLPGEGCAICHSPPHICDHHLKLSELCVLSSFLELWLPNLETTIYNWLWSCCDLPRKLLRVANSWKTMLEPVCTNWIWTWAICKRLRELVERITLVEVKPFYNFCCNCLWLLGTTETLLSTLALCVEFNWKSLQIFSFVLGERGPWLLYMMWTVYWSRELE